MLYAFIFISFAGLIFPCKNMTSVWKVWNFIGACHSLLVFEGGVSYVNSFRSDICDKAIILEYILVRIWIFQIQWFFTNRAAIVRMNA